MKVLSALLGLLIAVVMACVVLFTTLYVLGTFAAADAVRAGVPLGAGGVVGDRIEAWALGAYEPNTIDDAPLGTDPPITWTWPYSDDIPERADCGTPFGSPTYGVLSQGFHGGHAGIDIASGGVLNVPIWSTMCGRVVRAGWTDVGYGYFVVVANGAYATLYAHCNNDTIGVVEGQDIEAGTYVCGMGNSGNTSGATGIHLHYEVRVNSTPVNPCGYLDCSAFG